MSRRSTASPRVSHWISYQLPELSLGNVHPFIAPTNQIRQYVLRWSRCQRICPGSNKGVTLWSLNFHVPCPVRGLMLQFTRNVSLLVKDGIFRNIDLYGYVWAAAQFTLVRTQRKYVSTPDTQNMLFFSVKFHYVFYSFRKKIIAMRLSMNQERCFAISSSYVFCQRGFL